MFAMTARDKRELDAYRALGTVEELQARLASPYPTTDAYAPLPLQDHEELHLAAGLLEDDGVPIVDNPWADK